MPQVVRYEPYSTARSGNKYKALAQIAWTNRKQLAKGAKNMYNKVKSWPTPARAPPRQQQVEGSSFRKGASCGSSVKMMKGKKKCKVTRKFKAKVKCALEETMPCGKWVRQDFGNLSGVGDNVQAVTNEIFNNKGESRAAAYGGPIIDFFTPDRVLYVASVLYNGKAVSADPFGVTNLFATDGLKITVQYAYAKISLRNNTQRTKQIDFYSCTPKQDTNVASGSCFSNCFAQDVADGVTNAGNSISSIGSNPGMTKRFSDQWKYAVKSIILSPGQSSTFTVNGPKNLDYKYDRFNDGVTTYVYPKGIGLSCFYILKNTDVLSCDAAYVGAAYSYGGVGIPGTALTTNPQYSVTAQINVYMKVVAPEQTAVALRIPGRYILEFWSTVTSAQTFARCDVTNPQTVEADANGHGAGKAGPLG